MPKLTPEETRARDEKRARLAKQRREAIERLQSTQPGEYARLRGLAEDQLQRYHQDKLDSEQLADVYDVCRKTIDRRRQAGEGPTFTGKHRVRYPREAIIEDLIFEMLPSIGFRLAG